MKLEVEMRRYMKNLLVKYTMLCGRLKKRCCMRLVLVFCSEVVIVERFLVAHPQSLPKSEFKGHGRWFGEWIE